MIFRCGLFVLLIGILVAPVRGKAVSAWQPCQWHNEKCWRCVSGRWLAIVSLVRGRLSYFGTVDGSNNLLYLPDSADLSHAPTWGGHRFWLGPQQNWPIYWPAPADWERSASSGCAIAGRSLILAVSHRDTSFPQLYRSYTWETGTLHCKGWWTGGHYQAIDVFQVPASTEVEIQKRASSELSEGFGLLPIGTTSRPMVRFKKWPLVIDEEREGVLRIRNRSVEQKLGFKPGTITANEGRYGFRLERGQAMGEVVSDPNQGLFTQIYAGDAKNPYLEIEQLSPILKSSEDAYSSFEVVLDPFLRSASNQP